MKKTIIAPLAVLACAAVVATFALGGAGKFGDVQVDAGTPELSVTFNESNTTVEEVDGDYAICTTTAAGNKVGVVGLDSTAEDGLSFCGKTYLAVFLSSHGQLGDVGAIDFGHMTGFTIDFDGDDLQLDWRDENSEHHREHLESGTRFDVTCTPYGAPTLLGFYTTITSLTVHYTC